MGWNGGKQVSLLAGPFIWSEWGRAPAPPPNQHRLGWDPGKPKFWKDHEPNETRHFRSGSGLRNHPFPFPSTRLKCHPSVSFLSNTSSSLVPPVPLGIPVPRCSLIADFLISLSDQDGWLAFHPQDLAERQAPVATLSMPV